MKESFIEPVRIDSGRKIRKLNMNVRTPKEAPQIAKLRPEIKRPLWSVMIPTYNCIDYLKYAIESVLVQDMGEEKMQIEVVDDYSTDGDVEALVKEIGRGRVGYFRQEKNVGSLRNFETCINRATGHYVHLLHGDDYVKAGFYQEVESLFDRYPTAGSAITNYKWVDGKGVESLLQANLFSEPGIIENWLETIASKQKVQPPAVVVKREVYEKLGSFFGVHYGEDWIMWTRIAASYPVVYSPECLAVYRGGHSNNISAVYTASGKNLEQLSEAFEIIQQYLPVDSRARLKKVAKKNFSIMYARSAYRIAQNKANHKVSHALIKGSLKLSLHWRTFYWIGRCYLRMVSTFFKTRTGESTG